MSSPSAFTFVVSGGKGHPFQAGHFISVSLLPEGEFLGEADRYLGLMRWFERSMQCGRAWLTDIELQLVGQSMTSRLAQCQFQWREMQIWSLILSAY